MKRNSRQMSPDILTAAFVCFQHYTNPISTITSKIYKTSIITPQEPLGMETAPILFVMSVALYRMPTRPFRHVHPPICMAVKRRRVPASSPSGGSDNGEPRKSPPTPGRKPAPYASSPYSAS
jgi:hypothetical protein